MGGWYRAPIWEKLTDLYRCFPIGNKSGFLFLLWNQCSARFYVDSDSSGHFRASARRGHRVYRWLLVGALPGFIYSSIGLTVGSWLNFMIGRFLGEQYVRKRIPAHQFQKIDGLVKRQGVIVLFILFLFPGFPKDYLCLVLGVSTLPIKIFILLAGIGRMPGTFALSLQGAFLYEQNYVLLGIMIGACLILAFLCYAYRERIYLWIEKLENK